MSRLLLIFAIVLVIAGCSKPKHTDTPTSGTIRITVDEALKPLIDAEIQAFEGIYANAHIEVTYTSEEEAVLLMLRDSARATIITRKLFPEEEKILESQTYKARQLKVAITGVALIVNRQNRDTLITMADLKKILTGEIQHWNWNESRKKAASTGMEVVFDQPNSAIIRYLKDSVQRFDALPKNWFALKSNSEVVNYVSEKPQALGFIDLSWLSDPHDSTANKFLRTIKVMAISEDSGFFKPYQAYIAQKQYPLRREVVMIVRESHTGLASGFLSFLGGEKGQRVVLKAGLVPAVAQVRIVEISRDPIRISK
ncbi:MAG: substrate-binding domain-containing protein [Chryseolinea sp.]